MPPRARKATTKTTKPSLATGEPTEAEVNAALEVLDKSESDFEELGAVDDADNPIPDELQFTTTATEPRPQAQAEVLSVDGHELYAFKPEPAAWNLLIGAMSNSATAADRAYVVMDLVNHVFDDTSLMYIRERLMARGDNFDQAILEKIVIALIERWTPDLNRAQRRANARARR